MPSIKQLLQSMTNRLILITVVIFYLVEMFFAGGLTGLELYNWNTSRFAPYQFVSYMFLHGGLTHLLFNMIALWSFGRILEQAWGMQRFLIFYLACGIGAAVCSQLIDQFIFAEINYSAMVGASGAIYGILIAFAMLFPNFKIMLIFLPVPIAAKYFVPVLLLIDLSAGITNFSIFGQNIAHFAHIGGALVGFLLVKLWLHR